MQGTMAKKLLHFVALYYIKISQPSKVHSNLNIQYNMNHIRYNMLAKDIWFLSPIIT